MVDERASVTYLAPEHQALYIDQWDRVKSQFKRTGATKMMKFLQETYAKWFVHIANSPTEKELKGIVNLLM